MPKNFLRAEMQFSMQMCEKWQQDNPKLVQGVPLPSWLDAAELKVEGKSREADAAGETEGTSSLGLLLKKILEPEQQT